jgi:hypothetical protein
MTRAIGKQRVSEIIEKTVMALQNLGIVVDSKKRKRRDKMQECKLVLHVLSQNKFNCEIFHI